MLYIYAYPPHSLQHQDKSEKQNENISKQMDVPQKSCGKAVVTIYHWQQHITLLLLGGGAAEIMMSRSCRKIKSKHEGNGFQIDASHCFSVSKLKL